MIPVTGKSRVAAASQCRDVSCAAVAVADAQRNLKKDPPAPGTLRSAYYKASLALEAVRPLVPRWVQHLDVDVSEGCNCANGIYACEICFNFSCGCDDHPACLFCYTFGAESCFGMVWDYMLGDEIRLSHDEIYSLPVEKVLPLSLLNANIAELNKRYEAFWSSHSALKS